MIPFSVFSENVKKKFVGLYFTEESTDALRNWALMAGFDLTTKFNGSKQSVLEFDFHTTIFFTNNYVDIANGEYKIEPFTLSLSHFELLGHERNIPVLKINSDNWTLQSLRQGFEEMGFRDEWPEYKPHISLSYNWDGRPRMQNLEVPLIHVVADRIKVEDAD